MIETCALSKRFGDVYAVRSFDLGVPVGGRIAVTGPSGCGKTTLLRLIAGLELPDAGTVRIGGQVASSPHTTIAPHTRGIGFVFQDPSLFQHMKVVDNIAYGLRSRRGRRSRVDELLLAMGMEDLRDRYPAELSGGQQRRVALARALAPAPRRVLMDEPLTNLDGEARRALLETIDEMVAASGASLLYVTHDPSEAETLGCTVVRMAGGRRVG